MQDPCVQLQIGNSMFASCLIILNDSSLTGLDCVTGFKSSQLIVLKTSLVLEMLQLNVLSTVIYL